MSPKNQRVLRALSGNKGFTLIELMIVIAIIGILAGAGMLVYMDFTAKANDSTALNDAKFLLGVGSNALLHDDEMWLWHPDTAGSVIGDEVDFLGNAIPKLYQLSPGVRAEVQIINWDVPGTPPWLLADIWIQTYHERGSDSPWGLHQKKTYMIWVDAMGTGLTWESF